MLENFISYDLTLYFPSGLATMKIFEWWPGTLLASAYGTIPISEIIQGDPLGWTPSSEQSRSPSNVPVEEYPESRVRSAHKGGASVCPSLREGWSTIKGRVVENIFISLNCLKGHNIKQAELNWAKLRKAQKAWIDLG